MNLLFETLPWSFMGLSCYDFIEVSATNVTCYLFIMPFITKKDNFTNVTEKEEAFYFFYKDSGLAA